MIYVENLRKVYTGGENPVEALHNVSLRVRKGELAAIIGPSGSGKSTLMNVLGCLDSATDGKYLLNGTDVTHLTSDGLARVRRDHIGFVFQSFNLLPGMTAEENVALPLLYQGVPPKERKCRTEEALRRVGLYHRRRHLPAQMSGGQQQRVAIARALIARPPLLLADEPTGNLDSAAGSDILALLHSLHRQGTTILLITHDPALAAQCERQFLMKDGYLIAI